MMGIHNKNDAMLKRLKEFCEEVNRTNSILDKVEVIKKYPDLKNMFVYIYDKINYTYGVTSKNVIKLKHLGCIEGLDIRLEDVLDMLNSRTYTGHNAIKLVNTLLRSNPGYEDVILNILDRNLKTRTDDKLINRVYPDLIPQFNVALADLYDPDMNIDFTRTRYYASRKCDGVRLITIISDEGINFFSREGKKFKTLENLKKDIEKLNLKNSVLDGEVCIVDEHGDEHFKDIMKVISKKEYTIENPKYLLFDLLSIDEFENEYSERIFSDRIKLLNGIIPSNLKTISILNQTLILSEDDLTNMSSMAKKNKWEGLILRRIDSPYEGKRTKNLLKVKGFIDAEYIVDDVRFADIRIIEDGIEMTRNMLSKVIITHKGNTVGVGSGFTIPQRLFYRDHPEEIIGKTITVKYFEETKNDDGTYSLRFPTVKWIHSDGRET